MKLITDHKDILLARHIQKVRKTKKLTQEMLAEKIEVSTTWIGYIETAKFRPSLKLLYKIADALKVTVKDLFPF